MKKRLLPLTLSVLWAGSGWALDPDAQRLAERYRAIVTANPGQQEALDRWWKIYSTAGETDVLLGQARAPGVLPPVVAAGILERAGRSDEAGVVLRGAVQDGDLPAADLLAERLAGRQDFAGAAEVLEAVAGKVAARWIRAGELRDRAGQAESARKDWQKAVQCDPHDVGLRRALAGAARRAGDFAGAREHLTVIAAEGRPADRLTALQELSLLWEKDGHYAEAIAAHEAALNLMGPGHWERPAARQREFELHRLTGSLGTLEETWVHEAEARPTDPGAARRVASYFAYVGKENERLIWLRRAADLLPSDVELGSEVAVLEWSTGHPAEAAARLDRLIDKRPDDAALIYRRAAVAAGSGDEAGAVDAIENLLATRPGDEAAEEQAMEFYRRMRLLDPLEKRLRTRADPANEAALGELAQFYLEEHRDREAVASLAAWQPAGRSPEEVATVAHRFSTLLHERGLNAEAVDWAKRAVKGAASRPEYLLHLVDLMEAAGDHAAAREVLRQACQDPDQLPPEDLDRRLFLVVQEMAKSAPTDSAAAHALQDERAGIVAQTESPDAGPVAWQRAGRWALWFGDVDAGAALLGEAVQRFPDVIALRSDWVAALIRADDIPEAIEQLRDLVKRDPANALTYRRRIGHLELDRGSNENALEEFAQLAAEAPNDTQAASDLALAEQLAGNWFKAVETWERAYACASPEARPGVLQPYLNATTRLQLHHRGLKFLARAADAENDSRIREDLFREAASYAVANRSVAEWREQIAARLSASPEDRDWRMARVFLLEAEGKTAEARAVLAEIQQNLIETPARLDPLIQAADDAGDWVEAARLTRRRLALEQELDPIRSVQLANYLDRAGQNLAAEQAWTRAAAVFSRDPAVLTAAAEYFSRTGNEEMMIRCYRGAARLGGCAPQVLLRLGQLALDDGDRSQALEDFGTVLDLTRPENFPHDAILPVPDRLIERNVARPAGASGSSKLPPWPDATTERGCRLLAIRQLGRLLVNSPRKTDWIEKFTVPEEVLWAQYFSGDRERAYDAIESLADSPEAAAAISGGYPALLIEDGEGDRLVRWTGREPARLGARWDVTLAALERLLDAGWKPSDPELFQDAPVGQRWRICQVLAAHHFFREAGQLALGLPDALPVSVSAGVWPSGSAWLEMARWKIALRDPDGAIHDLDRAINQLPAGRVLAGPYFAAIRARWLLTPKDLREDFEKSLELRWQGADPGTREATLALLASLRGDHAAAARNLRQLSSLSLPSRPGSWDRLVQLAGLQLEDWGLDRLARDLYRVEITNEDAVPNFQAGQWHRRTETLLMVNLLRESRRESVPYLVNEWVARGPSNDDLLLAVDQLRSAGFSQSAARVLEAVCRHLPTDPSTVAGLTRSLGDPASRPVLADYVSRLLNHSDPSVLTPLVQHFALQLAAAHQDAGARQAAFELLESFRGRGLAHAALTEQRVRVLEALGRHQEALAVLEADAFESTALSLARTRLEAGWEHTANSFPEPDPISQTPSIAQTEVPTSDLNRRFPNPIERFRAGEKFLETTRDPSLVATELARLRQLVKRNRELSSDWYGLRRELAERTGRLAALEKDLVEDWQDGRGSLAAGENLLLLLLEQKRFSETNLLLEQMLDDVHFHEAAWDQAGQLLLGAGQPEQAARVLKALVDRAPGNVARALFLAEALAKSHRETEAAEIVFPIERLAVLDSPRYLDLAGYQLNLGNPDAARQQLERFSGPTSESVPVRSRLAEQYVKLNRPSDARDVLLPALAHLSDAGLLADYYEAACPVTTLRPGTFDLPVSASLHRALCLELAGRFLARDQSDSAWIWLEAAENPLDDASGRELAADLEKSDPERAGRLWEKSLGEFSSWDVRIGAAEFFRRRAQAESGRRIAWLRRSLELHPGSFASARDLVEELLRQNKPAEARRVYQELWQAFMTPEDRQAAREVLPEGPPE